MTRVEAKSDSRSRNNLHFANVRTKVIKLRIHYGSRTVREPECVLMCTFPTEFANSVGQVHTREHSGSRTVREPECTLVATYILQVLHAQYSGKFSQYSRKIGVLLTFSLRLNIAVLHTSWDLCDKIDKIDLCDIINTWIRYNEHRLGTFSLSLIATVFFV